MPVIPSEYKTPFIFQNGHINTIFSTLYRKKSQPNYYTIRLETVDNDFFDVDTLMNESNRKSVVLIGGLESDSYSPYVSSIAITLYNQGFDVFIINHRGCSGELNKLYKSYHSGFTKDLEQFINSHPYKKKVYESNFIIGFSLGGNITLKYLSLNNSNPFDAAVTISVPISLKDSALELEGFINSIYMSRFLKKLCSKLKIKQNFTKDELTILDGMKTFRAFDDFYTAPVNGYRNAEHYWKENSSLPLLKDLNTPTLLINALDDPFLGKECYPYDIAKKNKFLMLEAPRYGGHVGFAQFNGQISFYHEDRIISYLKNAVHILLILWCLRIF